MRVLPNRTTAFPAELRRSIGVLSDVKELQIGELDVDTFVEWHRMPRSLRELAIPLIVAIHGHCLGGGLMLTLPADYRLATTDVRMGLGALRHGILPGSPPELLPAIVGSACARRLSSSALVRRRATALDDTQASAPRLRSRPLSATKRARPA